MRQAINSRQKDDRGVLILRHPKEAKRKVVKTADLVGLCLSEGCCEIATATDFGPVLRAQQAAAEAAGRGLGGGGGPRWLLQRKCRRSGILRSRWESSSR